MRVKFFGVSELPSQLEADSFYYVSNGDYAESYVTDSAGTAKAVGNTVMVNQLVTSALASWESTRDSIEIVADIEARDALIDSIDRNVLILVIDASADSTVDSGSALYAYDSNNDEVYKVAEYESMDVTLQWSNISGRPTSSVSQIDSAVGMAHTHNNKSILDGIGEIDGELAYGGEIVSTVWQTKNW